jgi:hypothetical protein
VSTPAALFASSSALTELGTCGACAGVAANLASNNAKSKAILDCPGGREYVPPRW